MDVVKILDLEKEAWVLVRSAMPFLDEGKREEAIQRLEQGSEKFWEVVAMLDEWRQEIVRFAENFSRSRIESDRPLPVLGMREPGST